MLQAIGEAFFGLRMAATEASSGSLEDIEVLIEDQSTNCGANAIETKKVLDAHGVGEPRTVIVAQDPTMCLRTVASFQKTYESSRSPPKVFGWPPFVPSVIQTHPDGQPSQLSDPWACLQYSTSNATGELSSADLWEMGRFINLIMGEIPRLRDDVEGYGPKGKSFIVHVDVPEEVESAWQVLRNWLEDNNVNASR